MPSSPTATGKSDTKTPTKLTRKPKDDTSKPETEEAEEEQKPTAGKDDSSEVEEKKDTKDDSSLAEVDPHPIEDTEASASQPGDEPGGDVTEKVGDTVASSDAGPQEEPKEAASETAQAADQGVKDVTEQAPKLDILKGLEVDENGLIHDRDGTAIGRLVEGDAADLAGYPIGDDGEILDDDGDLVGRCELLPEKVEQAGEEEETGLPGLEILKGLTVDATGLVLNDDGDTVGQLVEGDVKELMGRKLNEKGEFLGDDGEVIGRVKVHPDAAGLVAEAEEGVEEGAEEVGEEGAAVAEEAGQAAEEGGKAAEEAGEAVDAELPGIEALEGHEIDSVGNVVDDQGNVVGELAEGDVDKVKHMAINDKGEVVDEDGNVIGKVALAEGAQEVLAGITPSLRILAGRKVNKKGKILDEEGEVLGELIDGDAAACAGKKVNERGEVLDKAGNVIGRVKVIPGEAADDAMKELDEQAVDEQGLPNLDILDGLKVNKAGKILNEDGEPIGELVDGERDKCAGKKCNAKGEVLDADGKVIGRVKTLAPTGQEAEAPAEEAAEAPTEEAAEAPTEEEADSNLPPLSILDGLKVNKAGKLLNADGAIVGELVEGDAKKLSKTGATCDADGQFWDSKGHVVGRATTVPISEAEEEAPFAGLDGLIVTQDGMVRDDNGNIVGRVVEGDAKKLVGRAVDEDGDIIDKKGSVVGHCERYEEPEPEEVPEETPEDLSILAGKPLNKHGNVIGDDGTPIGRLVEGNAKDLAGRRCDENGLVYNDVGKQVGRCELIPENERVARKEGPFAGFDGLRVIKDGKVADEDGNVVGILTEGDAKRLVGHAVDEDGDIIDKHGNVKGHAEPWTEEEAQEADLSALAGCTVNKAGNVVDGAGNVVGRVADGELKRLVGRKVDGKGQVWDNAGNVIGHAELVTGADTAAEGPFAGFESNSVAKDGTVQTQDGTIIGRVVEGDVKKLVGHKVDEDGDITDKNGNTIGKAERWEPEEKERRVNPMAGRRVNKEGEVRDENGDVMGRLTAGDLGHCVGLEIDDNGYVVDNDGNRVGEVTLLENIAEEEEEELSEEEQKKKADAELADKMANICQQTLERVQPVMKQITEYIEKADRTPREELDEEELVNNVKPLIEEGSRILQECNGSLRGLDPDGRIAQQAKGRAQTREATPEEYRLADCLKELTTTVVTTIDNAKKKISDMPHAKKKLNPLWGLLTEPLFQIIAAVGLLLAGVLGLVGRLLSGLGLGGLVNGLLGGLGIDKLLSGLGLGSLTEMLGGGKKKEKKQGGGGVGSLPLVGGLVGGK